MVRKTIKISIAIILIYIQIGEIVAQEEISVEKSLFEIQTGFAGVWVVNEMKIANPISLRTELGLNLSVTSTFLPRKDYYTMIPSIILEPRYYFNLKRRAERAHKIRKNSGTFVSIQTTYVPDWFFIPNFDIPKQINKLFIIPTLGVRYATFKHFTFEAGLGYGYLRNFHEGEYSRYKMKDESAINLHLRFGYWF